MSAESDPQIKQLTEPFDIVRCELIDARLAYIDLPVDSRLKEVEKTTGAYINAIVVAADRLPEEPAKLLTETEASLRLQPLMQRVAPLRARVLATKAGIYVMVGTATSIALESTSIGNGNNIVATAAEVTPFGVGIATIMLAGQVNKDRHTTTNRLIKNSRAINHTHGIHYVHQTEALIKENEYLLRGAKSLVREERITKFIAGTFVSGLLGLIVTIAKST